MKYLLLILLTILSFHGAIAQSLSIFKVDTTNFPTMTAKFYAFDAVGRQVRPSASELTLTENGIARTITSVNCPVPPPPKAISSVLVMDVSGSMSDGQGSTANIDLAKKAAQAWVNALPLGASEAALTSFDNNNYLNQDFTTDRNKLITAINTLTPNTGTDYDAAMIKPMAGGLLVSQSGKYQKIIVFLSDGLPNSEPNTAQIITEAKRQNCIIFCVTLGIPAPQCMKDMASQTGGLCFEKVTNVTDAEDVYRKILQVAIGGTPCELVWQSGISCQIGLTNVICTHRPFNITSSTSYQSPITSIAELTFAPSVVRFNNAPPKIPASVKVTVTATNSDFTVSNITSSNPAFSISPTSFTLTKGQSITLSVTFTPPDSGYRYGYFTVTGTCLTTFSAAGGFTGKKPSVPTLKLTRPNGGENYVVGSDSVITWEGIPATDSVTLEYSIDNGNTWKTLMTTATGLGYAWKNIPKPTSNECKVRIKQNSKNIVSERAGTLQFTLNGHTDPVHIVVWSPDGSKVATAGGDESARIWDATTGSLLFTLDGESSPTYHVSWSPDGTKVVTSNFITKIWDAATGALLITINEHSRDVGWSPDGLKIVTASNINSATIWEVSTGLPLLTLVGHKGNVNHLSWSPDGSKIVTTSSDTTIKIWNAASGALLFTLPEISEVDGTCWSPDGKKLITTAYLVSTGQGSWYGDPKPKVWDADSGVLLLTLVGHEGRVDQVAWSQDGLKVATASDDNTTKIWNPVTGALLHTLIGHTSNVTHVSWSPDCSKLLTGNSDETAKIWDAASGALLYTLAGHTSNIWYGSWSPDGTRVATASEDNTAKIWNLDTTSIGLQEDVSDSVFNIVAPSPASQNVDMKQCLIGSVKDSVVQQFIANSSTYPFKVDSIEIVGTDASQFSVVSGIPPFIVGAVPHAVEFRFRPASIGIKTAQLLIFTQADTLRQTITGEGISPVLSVLNQLIDFGQVTMGNSRDSIQAITIKNSSNSAVMITSTRHAGPNTTAFSTFNGGGNFILGPGDTAKLDLRFKPGRSGKTSGLLLFDYNGVGSPATVQLFGEGIFNRNDTLHTTVSASNITAQPGDKVNMTLQIVRQSGMQLTGAPTEWYARIHVNSSILFNQLTDNPCYLDTEGNCILDLTGSYSPASDTLVSIPCVATLGNTDNSIISIDDFQWTNSDIYMDDPVKINGSIRITGICEQGGVRLFIPAKNSTSLTARPNPAQNALQIQYGLREPLTVTLELLSVTGQVVQTIVNNQAQVAGQYVFTQDVSQVGNGVYVLRLKTNKETLSTRVDVVK